jgi:hypothetical protein
VLRLTDLFDDFVCNFTVVDYFQILLSLHNRHKKRKIKKTAHFVRKCAVSYVRQQQLCEAANISSGSLKVQSTFRANECPRSDVIQGCRDEKGQFVRFIYADTAKELITPCPGSRSVSTGDAPSSPSNAGKAMEKESESGSSVNRQKALSILTGQTIEIWSFDRPDGCLKFGGDQKPCVFRDDNPNFEMDSTKVFKGTCQLVDIKPAGDFEIQCRTASGGKCGDRIQLTTFSGKNLANYKGPTDPVDGGGYVPHGMSFIGKKCTYH